MNIQQFDYILAVAELRHFENAADKCYVTQSTLSTMISRFEEEIGIKIFDRKTKPVTITKEGTQIIQQLKQITYEISQLEELSREIKGEVQGALKIGCIPTVAPFLLPLFLNDFAKKYPDISIQIKENSTHSIIQQLKSRDLDIGIVSPPILESELVEYPLYDEAFVYFDLTQPKYPVISIADIQPENFWLMEESHCMRSQVINICDIKNQDPLANQNIAFKAGSIDSLIRFTKASRGKTLLPLLSLTGFPEEDKKYIRFFKDPMPIRNIELVTHHHFVKHQFIQLLRTEIIRKVQPVIDALKQDFC
ncbi:MAG: LysR family transcriptional regulator [Chitinophagales bacterium]|nr:LysR family transcriptional regulator [Chitinophagales bacterium]